MAYLDYPGLAYFKSLLDQTYLRVDYDGDTTIVGHVTFTNPITGDIDGRAKKDWLGQQFDTTYLKDIQPDESGALKLILGNGQISHLVTDTTVTQERSSANETYPVLLCYDENATADQIAKKVKYGHDVQINPAYGYIYAQGYVEKHPTYNRTTAQSSRVEWMLDFKDSVLNPVGQIYSYVDPSNQGGEHRMELRLYGNPHTTSLNLPNYNFETDTVSLGVSSTKGDKLTFFGYAPSTPIYLENGSTMRKSTVRGDQYGRDIITRDWLNLNGSITGLVHTYMDETIDGLKTFLKTVTIDSGDANNKAGLYVQGDANLHSNVHVYGNEDIDGNLNVDGTSDQHGNVHMYHNLDVDGNANTDGNQTIGGTLTVTGKITGNGTAEISGGSGNTPSLKVNGNEVVTGKVTAEDLEATDDLTVGDDVTIGGDTNVAGTINKISGNTVQEYVTYVTNQADTRKDIAAGLVDSSKGLSYNSSTGKIGVNAQSDGGLKFNPSTGALFVDFASATDEAKAAVLSALNVKVPLMASKVFHVNQTHSNATTVWRNPTTNVLDSTVGTTNKPFATIRSAVECATQAYDLGNKSIVIQVHKCRNTQNVEIPYTEGVTLPVYSYTTGYIMICAASDSDIPTIIAPNGAGATFSCTGGYYILRRLNIQYHATTPTESGNFYHSSVTATNYGQLIIRGCHIEMDYTGDAPATGTTVTLRSIQASSNGTVTLQAYSGYATSIDVDKGNAGSLSVFYVTSSGIIGLRGINEGNSGDSWHNISCSGTMSYFIHGQNNGSVQQETGGRYILRLVGNMTGKKCALDSGANVSLSEDCPGDTPGTVNANEFSWVRPASMLE